MGICNKVFGCGELVSGVISEFSSSVWLETEKKVCFGILEYR